MEQWRINRAGVLNFWYYDEEEFEFEEGRLLLRGSNGSGKSVTMQSLVPLLFDGNKSPERLDPFGSRARRMETYLLSEGLNLEERTGYLYLEFQKPESKRFLTIGMGMRARKNQPLQSWYFLILDNRRLGKGYDIPLYRQMGDKIPLTEKELRNLLGPSNLVFQSQKEYKAAVNEYLFGFEDLTDFDELITLLIQIRSPKLSKEFKPTTMYEIMQNSLITLTDEDLRPMSEAIENMDEIKLKVEALERGKKALGRIGTTYQRYNTYLLANKAQAYLGATDKFSQIIEQYNESGTLIEEFITSLKGLARDKVNYENELKQLKSEQESLKDHDVRKLIHEQEDKKKQLQESSESQKTKHHRIDQLKEEERLQQNKVNQCGVEIERLVDQVDRYLLDMEEAVSATGFDEHAFFVDEFSRQRDEGFSFDFILTELKKYMLLLDEGVRTLVYLDTKEEQYNLELIKLEKLKTLREKADRALKENERFFNEIKAEVSEKIYLWHGKNKIIQLEKEVLSETTERIFQYRKPYSYEQVKEKAFMVYQGFLQENGEHISGCNHGLQLKEKEIQNMRVQLDDLRKQKDIEPKRDEKVILNRRKLTEANINFVPLYKAIDFQRDVDETIKNTLEEALLDLGLLDALIIDPKDKEQVMALDVGCGDKYIFADPVLLAHDISRYLLVDNQEKAVSDSLIEDVLHSILLTEGTGIYLTEQGRYGYGVLAGKTSLAYQARYLGFQARKRFKQEQIRLIEEDINTRTIALRSLMEEKLKWEERGEMIAIEWRNFPGHEDLDVAYDTCDIASRELTQGIKNHEAQMEVTQKLYAILTELRVEAKSKLLKVNLPHHLGDLIKAAEEIKTYYNLLSELRGTYQQWLNKREQLVNLNEYYASLLESLDEVLYDVGKLSRNIQQLEIRLQAIEEQLAKSSHQEIVIRMSYVQSRLEILPNLLTDCASQYARIEEKKKVAENLYKELAYEQNKRQELVAIFGTIFKAERDLSYVTVQEPQVESEPKSLMVEAKQVLKLYGAILEEKKTANDRREDLQSQFFTEVSELVEYHLKRVELFKDLINVDLLELEERLGVTEEGLLALVSRIDIVGRFLGKEVKFLELSQIIDDEIQQNSALLDEKDRELFEDILINSISRKIRAKIDHSKKWVTMINTLMMSMNTSSGIRFSLEWTERRAEGENQLSTKELVDILRMDQLLLTQEHRERLMKHFRAKIQESRMQAENDTDKRSFLSIMKDILDYRLWFEFQLFYTKTGMNRKEMTNNAFFTFSGGEKAMAMYVPLFSAVYAKYQGGSKECPKIISLDEAFAGVDEKNINDMFRLMIELDLSFVANSQILFGDYESVPSLGIYELIRPENVTYVTTIRYKWNGRVRELIID